MSHHQWTDKRLMAIINKGVTMNVLPRVSRNDNKARDGDSKESRRDNSDMA